MDNPSGWRVPTPHDVLTFLFVASVGLKESAIFLVGSWEDRTMSAVILACGLAGIQAAKGYLSPRVRSILEEHDVCPHPAPDGSGKTDALKG